MLLLVNYRPEYSHHWNSKTYYTQLRLNPLGPETAEDMLSALLDDSAELAPLKQIIIEKTEGNPLFMEEIFQALVEDGFLQRNGVVKLVRPVDQLRLPSTVQDILSSRIDRLPPEAKDLLQTLAVVGTEFPLMLARELLRMAPEQLDRLLSGLQAGEFIYEQPAAGDVEYVFKHALTHDVAYNSLLTERRKLLHERTAQAIEGLYKERLEDHYADLARHYRSSDNAAKAVEYLRLAGEQAVRQGAYSQALANVEPTLRLIERLPEGTERLRAELRVRLMEGMAVSTQGLDSTERLRTFQRVCELSEQLGDISAEIQGRGNVAGYYLSSGGELSRGLQILRPCVDLAQRSPGGALKPVVHLQLALLLQNSGDPVQACSLLSELMTHFEPARQEEGAEYFPINPWVLVPLVLGQVQQTLGRSDEAIKLNEQALQRARQLKRPFSLSAAYAVTARVRHARREPRAARELAEAAVTVAQEHGFRNWTVLGKSLIGWTLAEEGQTEKGMRELEANVPLVPGNFQLQAAQMLAEAYLRACLSDRAICTLDEALDKCERSGARIEEAELYRLKGEAFLIRDSSATAEAGACFRKAIEVAKHQSAKWWELRATVNLAQLLRDTHRPDEARGILAEIYNWFTEGFDTADLKEAKALLDELRA
jgi:tetratricopeptide (TPR) repeat protein